LLCYRCMFIHFSSYQTITIMRLIPYLQKFILFNMAVALVPFAIQFVFNRVDLLIPGFWLLFAAFAAVHLLIYIISSWGMIIGNKATVRLSLGGTSLKFLLWMIFTFFYLRKYHVDGAKFLFNFFYLYLLHSAFEIYSLFCNLRDQKIK
jgi:hypothetical protein